MLDALAPPGILVALYQPRTLYVTPAHTTVNTNTLRPVAAVTQCHLNSPSPSASPIVLIGPKEISLAVALPVVVFGVPSHCIAPSSQDASTLARLR
jgi:hypothetical protein